MKAMCILACTAVIAAWLPESGSLYGQTKGNKNVPNTTAQDKLGVMRGKVVDADGAPLPGASVVLKSNKQAVATDMDGNFSLRINKDVGDLTITVSFIGMKTKTLKGHVGGKPLYVTLESDTNMLDEVSVVETGYGRLPRKDMVGAFTTVKADDIMMPAYQTIDQMLQGKIPGMIVQNSSARVGTNPKITIRGTSTLLGNTSPLWVVDGVIQPEPIAIDLSSSVTESLDNLIGNAISWLNPQDIETVTVLKDASATAVYGSKASNGVIVITTKKGRSERMSVRYSNNFSIRQRATYDMFNYMNSKERIQFSKEAYDAGARYQSEPLPQIYTYEGLMAMFNKHLVSEQEFMNQMQFLETTNTNWLKLLTRNSFSQSHNLSLSGGTEKVTYNASFGYSNAKGTEIGNDQSRFTSRLNIGTQITNRFKLDLSMNGSFSNTDGYGPGVSPQSYALQTSRAIPATDQQGNRVFYGQYYSYQLNMRDKSLINNYNIFNEMENSYANNKANTFNLSLNASYKLTDWLTYEMVGSYSRSDNNSEVFAGERTSFIERRFRGYAYGSEKTGSEKFQAAMLPFGGQLSTGNSSSTNYDWQNKLSFSQTFNTDHRVNAMVAMQLTSTRSKSNGNTVWGYVPERGEVLVSPTPPNKIVPIGGSTTIEWGALSSLYEGGWRKSNLTTNYMSVFATLAYAYKDRYVLNANMRQDASNRFGQDTNHQFNPTYSFGFSWRMAEEAFIRENLSWINQFNARVSYGIQGNVVNSISPELIASYKGILSGYNEYWVSIASLPNPLLDWESTHTLNLGLDVMLFNRLSMNLEYYTRRSNAIIEQEVAEEYGLSKMKLNGGHIRNRGVEFMLNLTLIKNKDFAWTFGFNASKNWNRSENASKVIRADQVSKSDFLTGNSQSPLKDGYPLSAFWSYSFAGLDHNTGYPNFNNIEFEGEGDNTIDPTTFLVYSGQSEPYFTGGFNTRFRYKDISVGADFAVLLGAKKRLPNPYATFTYGKIPDPYYNLSKDLTKRWKQPGDEAHTIIPALYTSVRDEYNLPLPDGTTANSRYDMWAMSDAMVASGSFLRCSQLNITYNLPKRICNKFRATSLSVSANMNNLFVIASSRWNGFDPELGDSVQPRMYTFGLSVGF